MTDVPLAEPNVPVQRELVRPGEILGRYEILVPLASGGMADVWVGRLRGQGRFERLVAIKTVRAEYARDPQFRALFLREAEIAATLHHANVVEVQDVDEVDGVLYQVMSLVDGDSLSSIVARARGPLPLDVALTIMTDVLRGLHAAHESVDEKGQPRGLVHRDVSPQNVLVGVDGIARIADFGIAKALHGADLQSTSGALRGKVAYFAPEQAQRGPLDRRTDVFAAGVVLWEALTGERLFRGEDLIDTLTRVTSLPIPDPSSVVRGIPPVVSSVVMRARERAPTARFQTAQAMADDLFQSGAAAGLVLSHGAVAAFLSQLEPSHAAKTIRTARSSPEFRAASGVVSAERADSLPATRIDPLAPTIASEPSIAHQTSKGGGHLKVVVIALAAVVTVVSGSALTMWALGRRASNADARTLPSESGAASSPTLVATASAALPATETDLDDVCRRATKDLAHALAEGTALASGSTLAALAVASQSCGGVDRAMVARTARALPRTSRTESSAWALLAASFTFDAAPEESARTKIGANVTDLLASSNPDGGFRDDGAHPGPSSLEATALAAWALVEAERREPRRVKAPRQRALAALATLSRDPTSVEERIAAAHAAWVVARAERTHAAGVTTAVADAARRLVATCGLERGSCNSPEGSAEEQAHRWLTWVSLAAFELTREPRVAFESSLSVDLESVRRWALSEIVKTDAARASPSKSAQAERVFALAWIARPVATPLASPEPRPGGPSTRSSAAAASGREGKTTDGLPFESNPFRNSMGGR